MGKEFLCFTVQYFLFKFDFVVRFMEFSYYNLKGKYCDHSYIFDICSKTAELK